MSNDYLPRNDDQFCDWVNNFITYLTVHYADFGLTIDDVDALDALKLPWFANLAAHKVAQIAARTATTNKNESRTPFEALVRATVARINAYPGITETERSALGLLLVQNSTSGGDLGMQDETPLALIDISNRLKHVMRIQNHTPEGLKKTKPVGVLGAEVWAKIGEAPVDPSECQLMGVAAKNQFSVEYAGADAGKQAHYMLRWVTAKGEKGNWSETESATIAA